MPNLARSSLRALEAVRSSRSLESDLQVPSSRIPRTQQRSAGQCYAVHALRSFPFSLTSLQRPAGWVQSCCVPCRSDSQQAQVFLGGRAVPAHGAPAREGGLGKQLPAVRQAGGEALQLHGSCARGPEATAPRGLSQQQLHFQKHHHGHCGQTLCPESTAGCGRGGRAQGKGNAPVQEVSRASDLFVL